MKVLLSWSSGKDSAWALHVLRRDADVEVAALLTTFNEAADRVAMHAVRRALVEAQAAAAGLPLVTVQIPSPCPNEIYEERMRTAVDERRRREDSRTWHSAISFSRMCGGIARNGWPAPAWLPSSRCGIDRRRRSRAR